MSMERELFELKERIAKVREDHARARGEHDAQLARMRKELGCDSIEELQRHVQKWSRQVGRLHEQLEKELTRIREGLLDE